jgi:hypothetical protein
VAFLAAFAIYECLFFLASIIVKAVSRITVAIVWQIFVINTVALIGLLVVNRIGVSRRLSSWASASAAEAQLTLRRRLDSANASSI